LNLDSAFLRAFRELNFWESSLKMTSGGCLNWELQKGKKKHGSEKELNSIRIWRIALGIMFFDVRDVAHEIYSFINGVDT
jgi:hypothetical protein